MRKLQKMQEVYECPAKEVDRADDAEDPNDLNVETRFSKDDEGALGHDADSDGKPCSETSASGDTLAGTKQSAEDASDTFTPEVDTPEAASIDAADNEGEDVVDTYEVPKWRDTDDEGAANGEIEYEVPKWPDTDDEGADFVPRVMPPQFQFRGVGMPMAPPGVMPLQFQFQCVVYQIVWLCRISQVKTSCISICFEPWSITLGSAMLMGRAAGELMERTTWVEPKCWLITDL